MIREELNGLFKLQEIESRREALEQAIKNHSVEDYMHKLRKIINNLEKTLKEKNKRIIFLKNQLRHTEQKLQESYDMVKQMENRIYSGEVTTIKELNILKEKQDATRGKVEKYEEKALEIMEELENLNIDLPQEKEIAIKKKKEYNEKQLKTRQEIDKIKDELSMIIKQKQELETGISPELLDKYRRIKKFKREPVASVLDGKCSGCMMEVSVMIALEVERHEGLIYCENCGRILV
ncbi:MAG: C4-type zinc ribbon domain-containing protein [Tepidanaerobacteraceae bacterium]|nr:C4-type zinc ribbon domain-containing protein [Tepidanaerobacteraceae bacterium]